MSVMWDDDGPDWFDEVRREWITRYAGNFPIQKRRAQLLNRRILDRSRRQAGARPNPYADNVLPHALARRATTVEGYVETFAIAVTILAAPIGWLAGIALYRWILNLIPHRLRSYPLTVLLCAAGGLGALTLGLYQPGTSVVTALIAPWLMAQIPATFLAAGIYGILNGWLAVDGVTEWWPLTPQPTPVVLDYPMGPDDMTAPGIFYQHDLDYGEENTPISPPTEGRRRSSGTLVGVALIASIVGIIWTVVSVIMGIEEVLTSSITTDLIVQVIPPMTSS